MTSDVYEGFIQKRVMNSSFMHTNLADCSANSNDASKQCSLQEGDETGFYESSSQEYG